MVDSLTTHTIASTLPRATAVGALSTHKLSDVLVENIFEGVVVLDATDHIVFANTAANVLFGLPVGDLIGRNGRELFEEEAFELSSWSMGHSHRYTATIGLAEGPHVAAAITFSLLELAGVYYRLVSIAAIPHLAELNDALIMGQRLAGIGTLTSSITHELNNPISIITNTCVNMGHTLAAEEPDSVLLNRYVNIIQRNAWRCVRLIDALRTYAHSTPIRETWDLNEIVGNALTLVGDYIKHSPGVTMAKELAETLPMIKCDANQMTQVLVNLLMNGVEALKRKPGELSIKTWAVPELDCVAVCVRDTGPGILEGKIKAIFEPFYTTKGRGEGMGLGLFIAAELVRQHDGWIRAQNYLDDQMEVAGAQFTIMLPTS